MKKFLCNIILFILPLVCFIIISVGPFYYAGFITHEFTDVNACIELQQSNPTSLFGLGYSDQTIYYKLQNANYYKKAVIALGTSRVMQFNSIYFKDNFYNCGGAVAGNYSEYKNFLENLSYRPDVIILGLDAWVFNDNWNNGCKKYNSFEEIEKPVIDKWTISKKIKQDWKNKWNFSQLNTYYENIGFNGRIKDNGFRVDGSYYYGDIYRSPETQKDYNFVDTFDRIATGTRRFEWGDHIDKDTIVQLDSLLKYCFDRNIDVIGFSAPFAPDVYNVMMDSNKYNYLKEIAPACEEFFNKYGFEFYDYLDVSGFQISADYFIDGFHGSEVIYGNIIKDMCDRGSRISIYVDENTLIDILFNAYDGKTFFDPNTRNN